MNCIVSIKDRNLYKQDDAYYSTVNRAIADRKLPKYGDFIR